MNVDLVVERRPERSDGFEFDVCGVSPFTGLSHARRGVVDGAFYAEFGQRAVLWKVARELEYLKKDIWYSADPERYDSDLKYRASALLQPDDVPEWVAL